MSPPPEPPPAAGPAGQADADARHVWALAMGLGEDASPERTNAYVSLLLEHVDADIGRLNAAAAICASRHQPDEDDRYIDATRLVDHARHHLTAAHADTDPDARERVRGELHAQWHPEQVPYDWDHGRRRRPGWWLRHLATRRVKINHAAARSPAGVQRLTTDLRGRPAGRMLYQVCNECHLVLIGKITTDAADQGLGLGTRLVLHAFAATRPTPGTPHPNTPPQAPSGPTWPTGPAPRSPKPAHAPT